MLEMASDYDVGIDPKYQGGCIRMVGALAATDWGVPIDATQADGSSGKSSTSFTTELDSERWPRAQA